MGEACVAMCNVAEATDVRRVVATSSSLGGVWHAAGALADGVLVDQTAATLRRVCAPQGALGTRRDTLECRRGAGDTPRHLGDTSGIIFL